MSQYNGKETVEIKPAIEIHILAPDAKLFAELTRQNIGHRLLISLGEHPLTAPIIQAPIETGNFQITVGEGENIEAVLAALKKFVPQR